MAVGALSGVELMGNKRGGEEFGGGIWRKKSRRNDGWECMNSKTRGSEWKCEERGGRL